MNANKTGTDTEQRLEDLLYELGAQRRKLDSLLEAAEVLEESGLFDLVEVVTAREEGEQIYEAFSDDPENLWVVQNLSLMVGAFSEIDPDQVAAVLGRVREGHAVETEVLADPPRIGLWGALRQFQDPDVQRGLGFLLTFLKMVGSRSGAAHSEERP